MSIPTDNTSTAEVTVLRLLPFGLLVRLPDERIGIIREREIAWDSRQRRNWRRQFKRGDTYRAVVLGMGHDERLELSLRLAENDPWQSLLERYQLGQVVLGTVEAVKPYGAFIDIEPGITGLLHQSRLPAWAQSTPIEQLLWPGDRINVALEHLDPLHRKIGLTLQRVLPGRWKHTTEGEARTMPAPEPLPAKPAFPAVAWNVLVVEDDQMQRDAVAGWLGQALQRVVAAGSAEQGLAALEKQPFDMVLMDFNLPGMSGLQALHQISARWPGTRRVLMTDWTLTGDHPAEIDQLLDSGAQLLIKPLLPSDLASVLTDALAIPESHDGETETATHAIERTTTSQLLNQRQRQQHLLADVLKRLRQVTGASHTVLFQFDRAQRTISIAAEAGSAQLQRAALPDLLYSPVRDVAADQQIMRLDDAQQAEGRVRYLRPLLDFRACLGVPLQHSLRDSYALFLFSPQPGAFRDSAAEQHAAMIALVAGALIERGDFADHAWEMQRLALLGQLSSALVHEINHQLSPINFALKDLERQCSTIADTLANRPSALSHDIHEAHEILSDLIKGVERLTGTARMFGRVTIQGREQNISIENIVSEVVRLVQDMARRANIHIHTQIDAALPTVRSQAVQLQQILLNVVLNAIQQIELTRGREGGRVVISAALQTSPSNLLQICVEDDAAGVHRELWERIFELGFTTRSEGGSGLGLYITRSLVEALGGHVYVSDSIMLWGTMFTIELPTD